MKLQIKGIPPESTEESLVNYLEVLTDTEVTVLNSASPIVVVDTDDDIDIQRLNEKLMKRSYLSHTLKAEKWYMKTLLVSNIGSETTAELLELYFINKKRGEAEVEKSSVIPESGHGLVTFKDERDAERMLQTSHRLCDRDLSLQPYFGTLPSVTQEHLTSSYGRGERKRGKPESTWEDKPTPVGPRGGALNIKYPSFARQTNLNEGPFDSRPMVHQHTANTQSKFYVNKGYFKQDSSNDIWPEDEHCHQPDYNIEKEATGRGSVLTAIHVSPEEFQFQPGLDQPTEFGHHTSKSDLSPRSAPPHEPVILDNLTGRVDELLLLKEDGFEKANSKCQVTITPTGVVILKGSSTEVNNVKLELYDAIEKVKSASIPFSRALVQFLQDDDRRDKITDHLSKLNQPTGISFPNDTLKVWALSQDSANSAASHIRQIISKEELKVWENCQSLLKEKEFRNFLDGLKKDLDVIIQININSTIVFEGFTEGVKAATRDVKTYLSGHKPMKRLVTMSPAEVRFMQLHAQKLIKDMESNKDYTVDIRINTNKSCIEITGKREIAEDVEKKVKEYVQALSTSQIRLSEPGIEEYFREHGSGLVHTVEKRLPCVVEVSGPPQSPQSNKSNTRRSERHPPDDKSASAEKGGFPVPKIEVLQGNITEFKASILVNVVGRELNLSRGALSKTFLKVGGEDLQTALSKNHRPADFGKVLITRSRGDLQCDYVYHAVCPSWKSSYGAKAITEILGSCLTEANKHHSESIAIPSVGAGGLGYPTDVLVDAFKSSLSNFTKKSHKIDLKTISLVIYDKQVYQEFKRAFTDGWRDSTTSSPHHQSSPSGGNSVNLTLVTTREHVEEAERLIKRHVKDAYCSEEIRDPMLGDPPGNLKGLITSLSGPVKIQLDSKKKTISLYGSKAAVDSATKEIFKCLHQSKPAHVATNPRHLLKTKGVEAYMSAKAQETIYAPSHWKNFNKRGVPIASYIGGKDAKYELVSVGSQETTDISKLLTSSWPGCPVKVKKVERIEHPELFQKFATRRQLFFSKAAKGKITVFTPPPETTTFQIQNVDRYCRKEINECLLFHGTQNVSGILDTGLDFRVGGNGKFGKGIYMAERAELSYQFSGGSRALVPRGFISKFAASGNSTQMFVVRAVLGNCYTTSSQGGYVRPPCMDSSCSSPMNCLQHGDRYDTVVGTAGYREFVIYDSAQCYPDYLLTLW